MRKNTIGKLTTLGVKEFWQAALLLPRRQEFFTKEMLAESFEALPQKGDESPSAGFVVAKIVSSARALRENLVIFDAVDRQGNLISVKQFGHARTLVKHIPENELCVIKGKLDNYNGEWSLIASEVIDRQWIGKSRPVYPGNGSISPDTVRKRILELLPEALPEAAQRITDELPINWPELIGSKTDDMAVILKAAHLPPNAEAFERAVMLLERASALHMITKSLENRSLVPRAPLSISRDEYEKLLSDLPFELTETQKQAVEEILEDLRRPVAMRRLLMGDVGTGKTITYLIPAVISAKTGNKVAIMLPNVVLASQIHSEAVKMFGDGLNIILVQGKGKKKDDEAISQADIVIGTTALLHRNLSRIDMLVVDEQQKFSKEQRERLLSSSSHLLEVSATPIPRSQALVEFGGTDLSILKQGHANKTIHTKIRLPEDRKCLFEDIKASVESGEQVAIVYPLKHDNNEEDNGIKAATKAYEMWEKHFPDRVRLVHGDMLDEEKQAAVADMKQGKADVLVSTSVIEVGVTIPNLMRLVVVDADRYGLSTLHQLRGRLARHGGIGHFDLYLSEHKPDSVERLSILEKTNDGMKVAEWDLKVRGYGELDGNRQSGESAGFLLDRKIPYEALSEVSQKIEVDLVKPDPIPWANNILKIKIKPEPSRCDDNREPEELNLPLDVEDEAIDEPQIKKANLEEVEKEIIKTQPEKPEETALKKASGFFD